MTNNDQLEGLARELLEAKNFSNVGTIRKDGSPRVVPTWVDTDGEHVLLNSAEGRAWVGDLDRDPHVAVTVQNHENPYEYVQIRGRVTERTNDGADEHINAMAKKYLGKDEYPFRQPGEQRVLFRIKPDRVQVRAPGR
jgi:PPOX class probable F420-dependent enzyme